MKSILLILLSLCSPLLISSQVIQTESQDYIDVVAPYPNNRRPENDRRAQSFLAGEHSPSTMKILANMLYDYLKGVSHPPREDEDYEDDPHIKGRNLELVQDAFEKTTLRRLLPPPSKYSLVNGGPPLPGGLPPPPSPIDDYDVGAPAFPPVQSDKPPPPPMPKGLPNRLHPEYSTPTPPTSTLPSRVLLFRPSQLRKRPDEFIVRPPPQEAQFSTADGKKLLFYAKSEAAPIFSINQMPYQRPFAIPLPPYMPPSKPSTVTFAPPLPIIPAYRYSTNARVESLAPRRPVHSGYVRHPVNRTEKKKPCPIHQKFMHLIYPKWPLPQPVLMDSPTKAFPPSGERFH